MMPKYSQTAPVSPAWSDRSSRLSQSGKVVIRGSAATLELCTTFGNHHVIDTSILSNAVGSIEWVDGDASFTKDTKACIGEE